MKTKIIYASSPEGLNSKIEEMGADGWLPLGSHSVIVNHSQNRYSGSQHMDTIHKTEYSITMQKTAVEIAPITNIHNNTHKVDLESVLRTAEDVLALKPDGFNGDRDGYDSAIIGITDNGQLVYSKSRMVDLLVEMSMVDSEGNEIPDPMTTEDAWEFLEFNCFDAYVGEQTPIFIETFENN